MERLRRLCEFWNWLPAFRAVAETSHLPSASEEFGVSASALSRAIHLLEKNLGIELFQRQGRGLQLNEAGEQFLAVVRDAMRLVDDGLSTIGALDRSGPFYVSTSVSLPSCSCRLWCNSSVLIRAWSSTTITVEPTR